MKPDKSSGSVPRQKFSAKKEAKRKAAQDGEAQEGKQDLGAKGAREGDTDNAGAESGFTPYYSVQGSPSPKSLGQTASPQRSRLRMCLMRR